MKFDSVTLEAQARIGALTDEDVVRLYNAISRLHLTSLQARSERRHKEKRVEAHAVAVANYAVKMAPVFGIEASQPTGDRV